MREIGILTKLEFRSLFGWNKFRHTKDKKEKKRYLLLLGICTLLALMGISYVVGLSFGLSYLEMGGIIPAYLAFVASVIVFVVGIFRVGNTLFRTHGYGLLTAMPISARAIVLSRWIKLYIENLALTLFLLIPGLVTYGIMEHPAWYAYPLGILLSVFLPLLPLCLSAFIGTGILWIASRVKHKALAESLLMVVLVLAILTGAYFLGMNGEDIALDQLADLARIAGDLIDSVYPPAVWYADAVLHFDFLSILLSIFLSVFFAVLTVTLAIRSYHGILRRLRPDSPKKDVNLHTMEQKGLLQTLCRREAKRYFSSSIYVTNTIIGPILGAVAAIALMTVGISTLETAVPPDLGLNFRAALPMALASIFCMMPATATAYSMEGKPFWVIKTLPIPTASLLDAKVLFWLLLISPFYLVAVLCTAIAVASNLMDFLWILALPAAAIVFSAIFGITVDLKFGKTEWENEVTVVKQSASAGVGGFAGFLISIACCLPLLFFDGIWSHLVRGIILILLLTGTCLLRRMNNRKRLCDL